MTEPAQRALRWVRRAWRLLVGDSWWLAAGRVLVVLAVIAIGGLLFVSAGLTPIAASDGHWPPTRVFLNFVMRRSVATSTIGVQAPPLDDPALVARGAGHYATGCLPCHGAPGVPRSPAVMGMLPPPPYLPGLREELTPEETFRVVKHGLKYTAMPAWTAKDRDDEVWAMVAFLQRLRRLDDAQFKRLAHGELAARMHEIDGATDLTLLGTETSASTPALANCIRCHGSDGIGRDNGAFPRLTGQTEAYLRASLAAYARGERRSGMMQSVVAGLDDRELDHLARYFADLDTRVPALRIPDSAAIARGRRLANDGDPQRRIASCVACHGPGDTHPNPAFPVLAGQYEDYLALQLRLFKRGTRGGTAHAPVMEAIAGPLQERDIRDLAAYYASLR